MAEPKDGPNVIKFPTRTVLILIGAISLALIVSAGHSFFTLSELRLEYLENRARDYGRMISQMAGGRGRRSSHASWELALQEIFDEHEDSLRYIAIVDREGGILSQVGFEANAVPKDLDTLRSQLTSADFLYVHEMPRGGGPWWETDRLRVDQMVLVLNAAQADFLVREAYIHLVIAGIALLALWSLSYNLIRTVRQFLRLKVREESERHLTSLGRMSATLAHEIRNPLGAMKGLTQIAREELPADHFTQEMLKTVVEEAKRLEGLVTDLLDFARRRDLEFAQFDLVDLVNETAALMGQENGTPGTSVAVRSNAEGIAVKSDRDGLKQVLLNIIKNAVEASAEGRQVSVELQARGEKEAVITVRDQGSGIGETDPEELFEPFKTTKLRGSGLGLAVSRQIITRLGGRISLSNNSAGGASCTIEIPRKVDAFEAAGDRSSSAKRPA